jgi:flagellar biosynthesis/type III secretory pathway M-ring protein FliF/YscJ
VNNEKGAEMATWIWIVIAIAAVVVLAVVLFAGRKAMQRRAVAEQREQAQELRQEATERHRTAKERESLAQELAERAKAERKEGDKAAAHAARIDPDGD